MTVDWPVMCPHCGDALLVFERDHQRIKGLRCHSGHLFDAARQGYVNLMGGQGSRFTPDSPQMIMARERAQNSGVFDPLNRHLSELVGSAPRDSPELIVDCGAGTGYYLHHVLDRFPESRGIALDLSPSALKRAAKHERALALVSDLWQRLPVRSASVEVLLNIFAPRNISEYARVLKPGGLAVVVIPRPGHLAELSSLGMLGHQEDKCEQLKIHMEPLFGHPITESVVSAEVSIDHSTAVDLVYMGPAGHHREIDDVRSAVDANGIGIVTVALDVVTWQMGVS